MTKLFLIRGLPGSGKSSLASALGVDIDIAADDFMHENFDRSLPYIWEGGKVPLSHSWCEDTTFEHLHEGRSVAVANTFTQRWEMEPYLVFAKENGIHVTVIDLYDGGCSDQELVERNVHGVPVFAFARMRERYEHNWRNGNPIHPRKR